MNNRLNLQSSTKQTNDSISGAIWLWCLSEDYEETTNDKEISSYINSTFTKEGKSTGFIYEFDKSKEELLSCISKVKNKCNFIYIVIKDTFVKKDLETFIPDFCGIFCYSNSFGSGYVTQILKEPKFIKE